MFDVLLATRHIVLEGTLFFGILTGYMGMWGRVVMTRVMAKGLNTTNNMTQELTARGRSVVIKTWNVYVITWKRATHYLPLVRRIHCVPVGTPCQRPTIRTLDNFFIVMLDELLNKQLSYRRFQTRWRSCHHIWMIFVKHVTASCVSMR